MSSVRTATYVVAQHDAISSDANPGTEAQPWRTIGHACAAARPGDVILIRGGVYHETIAPQCDEVTFQAFGEEAVIIAPPPGELIDAASWRPHPGTRLVYQCPLALEAEECVVTVDGFPIEYVMVQGTRVEYLSGDGNATRTDVDRQLEDHEQRRWTRLADGTLQINLGGDDPAAHEIRIRPANFFGVDFRTQRCRVSGIEIHGADTGVHDEGQKNHVQDCVIFGAGLGAYLYCYGATIRRCVFRQCSKGMHATYFGSNIIEHNLFIASGYRPLKHRTPQENANVPWGPSSPIIFSNSHYNILRYNVIVNAGWIGWWPDVNCYGTYVYGNVFHRIPDRAMYNEYPANESNIMYNAVSKCDTCVTSRFSWRMRVMYNHIDEVKLAVFSMWGPHIDNPYAFDNLIAKNLVNRCPLALEFRDGEGLQAGFPIAWPMEPEPKPSAQFRIRCNQIDENRYRAEPTSGIFARMNDTPFDTLEAFRTETGMEEHGRIDPEATMEDFGLGLYSIRVPECTHPHEAVAMVGNPMQRILHCDLIPYAAEDHPYFWGQGLGDDPDERSGFDSTFRFGYEWLHFQPGVRRLIRAARGADPHAPVAPGDPPQVWLECVGHQIDQMHPAGGGFWSPMLPTVPGAELTFSWQVRGEGLAAATLDGGPVALARFQSFTGQLVVEQVVYGRDAQGQPVSDAPLDGDFDWQRVTVRLTVPAGCQRVGLFLGLKPAQGTVRYGDIYLHTAPGEPAPAPMTVADQQYTTLDLAPYLNRAMDADCGASPGAPQVLDFIRLYCYLPNIDLSQATPGMYTLGDIPFAVGERVVSLGCFRRPPVELPMAMDGIRVGRTVRTLNFLHGGEPATGEERGMEYWRYLVHYQDGATVEVVPVVDETFLQYKEPFFDTQATLSPAVRVGGVEHVGPVLQWVNLRPEVPITAVDFRTMDVGSAVLVAITAGE